MARTGTRNRNKKWLGLVICATVAGCNAHPLFEPELTWWTQYSTDPNPPKIDPPYSTTKAGWLSMAFPFFGFAYIGHWGQAIITSTIGLPVWPIGVHAIRAANEAERENMLFVARAYHALRPAGWIGRDYGQPERPVAPTPRPPRQPPRTHEPTFCQCGKRNPPGARFCGGCGEVLSNQDERR